METYGSGWEGYRPIFQPDFYTRRYEYQKKVKKPEGPYGATGIETLLKADQYILGQTVENITAIIGLRS